MAYLQTQWNTGDPITQSRMNHIEEGIAAALDTADGAVLINNIQNTRLDNLDGDIRALNDRIGGGGSSGETLEGKISVINAKLGNGVSDVLGQTVTDQLTAINTTIGNDFSASEGNTITDRFASLTTRVDLNLEQATLAWNELIKSGVTYDSTNKIVTNALKDIMYTKLLAREAYLTPLATDKIPGENNTEKTISSLADRITHIYRAINTVDGKTVTNATGIRDLAERTSSIESNLGLGAVSVGDRLDALDGGTISSLNDLPSRNIKALITEIANAHISDVYLNNLGNASDYGTLESRFHADELRIKGTETEINDAHRIGLRNDENELIDDTLDLRFDHIDGGTKPTRTLPSVISEIEAARDNAASLNDRISALDNSLNSSSLIARVGALETNKVNISDIRNDLTHDESNKPLSAAQGKLLKDTIGGDYNASNTVASAISDLLDIDTATDTRIDAIDTRIDAIDGGTTPSRTLPNLIDEVEGARSSTIKGTLDELTQEVTPLVYNTVDERLEAIEKDIDTIAKDLDMYDSTTGEISDLHTRVDTIAANLIQMANEIGMILDNAAVHDLQSAWTDTSTRIDDIVNEINAAHRLDLVNELNEPIVDNLDRRFDDIEFRASTLEEDITDEETGLAATKAIADEALTKAKAAAVASEITPTLNNLNTRLNSIDGGNALNTDNGTLAARVAELEKSTTTIINSNCITYNNNIPTVYTDNTKTVLITPLQSMDYLLLNTDNKYYYWKYITGEGWQLISGGGTGGSGTSSGEFVASLESISEPDLNTDYFVGDNINGYLHYRFVETETEGEYEPALIGVNPDNIKRYNITKTLGKKREYNEQTQSWVETDEDVYYLNLYEFDYGQSNAENEIDELLVPLNQIELPQGGGGGSGSEAIMRVVRITPATVSTVSNENRIYLRFFYSSVDATGESHEGTYTLKYNNGSIIATGNLNSGASDQTVTTGVWPDAPRPVGFYEIDITEYCRLGTLTFNLVVSSNGQNIPRNWTVNILELRLESNAPSSQLIETGNTILFSYIPYGAMAKTLHVAIDGNEIGTLNLGASVSGSELEYTIPSLTHGAHTISAYLTTVLDGVDLTTAPITRDYIWHNDEDENLPDIIIASPYRGQNITIELYAELNIPYTIYNRNSATSVVQYYAGDNLIDTVTVSTNGILTYAFEEFGSKTLRIVVDDVSLTFNITVTDLKVDVALVPGAVINFDPTTLSNNSSNRLPSWTYNNQTYHMTVSDNFNWSDSASGGGYKEDVDGKCFVIKAGTYAEFDYKMFKLAIDNTDPENPVFTNSVFDKGAEMKIVFKVVAVRDASAVWFSNVGNPSSTNPMSIGIQLSAHQGWLKTSGADAAEKQAIREGTVASTNSYLYFPYSEEDKIELDININKTGNGEDFIMSYEDGVPSKAYSYETNEILYHEPGQESVIHIGSPDCDVYIYKFRIYDKGLGTSDILRNFIADGKTITEKVNRYNRNSIYYDSTKPEGQQFTPYKSGSAVLDPEKLALKMPDVKILMLEAPTFTKSKKTFVKSSLRCIHAEGGTIYSSRGDEDNWLFLGGYHSGQGTTSDNYGQSSRNVDFLFECDGVNRPSDKVEAETNYVSTLIKGVNKSVLNPTTKSWTPTVDAEAETCLNWKGNEAKVSLTPTSVPNNYFNLKVNVASSENVNNALFLKRYNDFLPYISPAKARDNRIKNDMEFVPAILFIRETDTTTDENGNYTKHLEFNDTEWHFYSLGNIGDSKKTDYTRAYDPTDENEFTVEISDNNTSNSLFQSGVYISNDERVVETADSGINSMNYIWDITDEEWNAQRDPTEKEIDHDYRVDEEIEKYEDGTDVENNLTHYILPNGKVYVNYRHRMLSGDPFDGDHTFEFRYASCGDYRDGKIVNPKKDDPDPTRAARYKQIKALDKRNRAIIEAFYEWIVTASNSEFVNELAEWCVPEALEYFYAFTHFYTMMDNRAKNTFWHFAKTGTPRVVHHPHPALLHVYTELVNGEYVPTEDTEVDSEKTYYTEYAFDLWAYDMDTAAGIDNNGELIFPYGKEDTDYRQAGVSSSGYVFNGAGSIIWRRLSQSFTSEIANIFDRVNEASCFDAASLITQFDNFLNCYPEEMWRLDIERKYIRTFTGKVYDNCKLTDTDGNTKQNTRFLKEMMQGRKKYQRRQWVRDLGIYFGSKYMLSNVRSNTIEMVCYTPDAPLWNSRGYAYSENGIDYYRAFLPGDFTFYGTENNRKLYKCLVGNTDSIFDATKWVEGVTPNYQLKIVPYQDMYINVAVGNGNLRTPLRAVAGQEYTIDCTANMNETRVYIYAGSYIQAISGLAPFYIGANIFSSAARLKKLDLGTDNPNYHNTNLKSLTILPNMPILEELNIKNCDSLNTAINLSESNNLKIVEAEGSIIPSLSLPAYTAIETLHLPSTVNILSLLSARKLTDFYMKNKDTGLEDYSNLINMNITDSDYSSNIDWISIALSALPHLSSLYLLNLNVATVEDITDIEPFATRKAELETLYDDYGNLINKLNLSGLITVTDEWSEIEKDNYEAIWSNLSFSVIDDAEHKKVKHLLTYHYEMNGTERTYSMYVNDEATILDIYYNGILSDMPERTSTALYSYTFGSRYASGEYIELSGWKKEGESESLYEKEMRLGYPERVKSDTHVYAVFISESRKYPVRWYLERTDSVSAAIKTSTAVAYGGGTTLEAPTVADIQNANRNTYSIQFNNSANPIEVTYRIFNGWEKLPININPSATDTAFNIYATWLEGKNVPLTTIFADTTTLNPVQLLVFANMSEGLRSQYLTPGLQFTIQTGYTGLEEGELLIGPGATHQMTNARGNVSTYSIARFDSTGGTSPFISTILPLKAGNDEFTLAIDYSFDLNAIEALTANEAVLVSCYERTSTTAAGFRLYYRKEEGPKISFGDTSANNNLSRSIGSERSAKYRNTIVLRHPKNSTTLYIYSGVNSDSILSDIANELFIQTIEWNNPNTDAAIVFGNLALQNDSSTMVAGKGIIYWAKYWNKDLGVGECRLLANWNHENMTYAIQEYAGMNSIINRNVFPDSVSNLPNLVITSLTAPIYGHTYLAGNRTDNEVIQWPSSELLSIANTRIFNSLPIALLSIITKSPVRSRAAKFLSNGGFSSSYNIGDSDVERSNDYIFFPSSVEYGNTDTDYYKGHEAKGEMWWHNSGKVTVYSYNTGTGTWSTVTGNADYMNLRFPGIAIHTTTTNRIFTNYNSTTPVYDLIEDPQRGDIVIYNDSDAYIYVSNTDVINGAKIVVATASSNPFFYCRGGGGWVKAESYWTRSPFNNNGTKGTFMFVDTLGTLKINPEAPSAEGQGYNYSFSI